MDEKYDHTQDDMVKDLNLEAKIDKELFLHGFLRSDFTDDELQSAKKNVVTNLKTIADQQFGLDDYYLDQTLGDFVLRPEKFATLVSAVSAEDVLRAVRDIQADTVYFLSGPQEGENDD